MCTAAVMLSPHRFQPPDHLVQVLAAEDLLRVAHQKQQQLVLFIFQRKFHAVFGNGTGGGVHSKRACRAVQRQSLAVAIGQNGVHCLAQGQRFGVDRVLAGAQLGQLKQAVDQGLQVGLPSVDSLQIALTGSFIGGCALQQGLGISADGGQRAFDVPLA